MPFNSIDFAIFLPTVFFLFWFVFSKKHRLQNLLIVAASFLFYGWWDWRFLILLMISIGIDYSIGLALAKETHPKRRKGLLWVSIIGNLGLLGFFKYYNFFLESFVSAFSFLGTEISVTPLAIVLPVGISFYTFQSLSYAIDVYKRKIEPTRDLIAFTAFVSFFPQLVAGPIERATHLLPQFLTKRNFNYEKAVDGMRQILWGLFKKIVIADNCAKYVNLIFNNDASYSGSTLLLGAVFFAFQIYGDFSGYSDIAIGTARLFGFDLMKNFNFPYFSRDIAEFWRRWHISLTSWFKDYVYIPLGGSKGGKWINSRNILIVFLLSGFWHGANWTFIAWGALNALYFLPLLISGKNRTHLESVAKGRLFPTLKEFISMIFTFLITTIAWIFFRAESLEQAIRYLSNMISLSLFSLPPLLGKIEIRTALFFVFLLIAIEWLGRDGDYALSDLEKKFSRFFRWGLYVLIILTIYFFGNFSETIDFIYFQF